MSREFNFDKRIDRRIFKGEDRDIDFEVDDGVEPPGTTPFDISGQAHLFTVSLLRDTASIFTKATGGSGITFPGGGTDGISRVRIDRADTLSLDPGRYWYVLERTDAGNALVLAFGELILQDPAGL